MDPVTPSLSDQLSSIYLATLSQVYAFLPKFIGALFVLILGTFIAKWVKRLIEKGLELLHFSKLIKNTPVESFVKNAEWGSKVESIVGNIVYWLFMLLVFQTAVSVLGLSSLAYVLDRVVSYIPTIFSAIVILFLGVLTAGVVESLVKGSIRTIDGKYARGLGKVASYLTLIIFVLAAILELGIAQQFITILFVGLVTTITLSLGLSVGLGSKEVVGEVVHEWYRNLQKDLKKHK